MSVTSFSVIGSSVVVIKVSLLLLTESVISACQGLAQCLWFGYQHLHGADRLLSEATLAVAEVVMPHADETFRVTELGYFLDVRKKTLTPHT